MCKNLWTFLLFFILPFLLLNTPLFSGEIKQSYPKFPTAEDEARFFERLKQYSNVTPQKIPAMPGHIELGRTWYDYACNTVMGRTMAHAFETGNDGIHFVFMKILPPGAERYVTYDYFDLSMDFFYGNIPVNPALGLSGWGRVVNGRNDEALSAFHSNILGGAHLYQDNGEAAYNFSSVLDIITPYGALFAGVDREGDVVVFTCHVEMDSDTFMVSRDYMQNWISGNLVPNNYNAEIWPQINPDSLQEISYAYLSSAGLTMATTNDDGQSWDTLLVFGSNDSIPYPGGAYTLISITQYNNMYSQDGTFHLIFNGYGIDSNMVSIFPIIYWNERDREFIELTSPDYGHPQDPVVQAGLMDYRPGNAFGNAYPQLSEGPNGDLIAIWQQWEADSTGGLVTVIPPGGNEVFMTDIWGAYSPDGGLSWSEPFFIAGTPVQSDVFPNITDDFIYNSTGDSILLDIMYLWDTVPGVSLFGGGNDPSECIWYYERVAIAFSDIIVGIKGHSHNTVANQFTLRQNYPNPFNPVTKIKYGLKSTSPAKLEIYNVAGEKVATLVEGKVSPGEYEVTFDGADLPSGVYFYRLSSGDFSQTKKMILMR